MKLPDGRLFVVMRTATGSPYWSVSGNQGETWTPPRPLLRKDGGEPLLHPLSPCPIYDIGGESAGSGRYALFIHNHDGHYKDVRPGRHRLQHRRPSTWPPATTRPTLTNRSGSTSPSCSWITKASHLANPERPAGWIWLFTPALPSETARPSSGIPNASSSSWAASSATIGSPRNDAGGVSRTARKGARRRRRPRGPGGSAGPRRGGPDRPRGRGRPLRPAAPGSTGRSAG